MSIAPPSDIVLDVAQAADPQRLQAANAKLARMASGAGAGDFAAALGAAASPVAPPAPRSGAVPGAAALFNGPRGARMPGLSPYQKFEAVVLQNFVQNVLPKDENLFGDAASADICRSMLAEQVAMQMAKTGKLGIAKLIEAAHGDRLKVAAAPSMPPAVAAPVPASAPSAPAAEAPSPSRTVTGATSVSGDPL